MAAPLTEAAIARMREMIAREIEPALGYRPTGTSPTCSARRGTQFARPSRHS